MTPESRCAAVRAAVLVAFWRCLWWPATLDHPGRRTAPAHALRRALPHHPRARRASDTGLTRGELALDGKGCLRPTQNADPGPQDLVPIWPSTFEPDPSGGEVRILAGERVVAQVGKAVEMCGGETSAEEIPRGNDPMGERELREVAERCPDYYRFVGAGTRIPGNASGGSASPAAAPIPDVVGMKVEEVCPPLRRAGGNAYVFGKREVGDASVIPGHIVAQRPATRVLRPGPEDPRNTLLFVAKPFADTLPNDTSCIRGEVGPPG